MTKITYPKQIFASLEGTWAINKIFKHREQEHSATGRAKFTPLDENTLHYREEVITDCLGNDQQTKAYREYIFSYQNKEIIKYFCEAGDEKTLRKEKIFYQLEFGLDRTATGTHKCGMDVYNAIYDFSADSRKMSLTYQVLGPQKDYVIVNIFTKIDSAEEAVELSGSNTLLQV